MKLQELLDIIECGDIIRVELGGFPGENISTETIVHGNLIDNYNNLKNYYDYKVVYIVTGNYTLCIYIDKE